VGLTGPFVPHDAVQALVALHALDLVEEAFKALGGVCEGPSPIGDDNASKVRRLGNMLLFTDVDADHDDGRGNPLNPLILRDNLIRLHHNASWMSFGL